MIKCALIVDDNAIIIRLCRAVLSEMGFRIFSAESGEAAWDILIGESERIGLLLTDIRMGPDMDGIELGSRVRKNHPRIKIIYMSGFAFGNRVSKMLASESSLFLPKPFTVSDLSRMVERAESRDTA